MPLFNTDTLTPAQQSAAQILQIARQQYQQLARTGTQGYNLIWNNRQATPQEVIAALGTNAQAIFGLAQLNIETITECATIAGVTPPTLPSVPSNYAISFNPDGSATVTQTSSSSAGTSSSSSGVQ